MHATALTIKVVAARGLSPTDRNGQSDPYCKISSQLLDKAVVVTSKPVKKTLNPEWSVSLCVPNVSRTDIARGKYQDRLLTVDVVDWNLLHKHESMGRAKIDISAVLKEGADFVELWLPLYERSDAENKRDKLAKNKSAITGEIKILLILDDPNISDEDLLQFKSQVRLASEQINLMHVEWKRAGAKDVTNVADLLAIFKRTGVLEACVTKWNGGSDAVKNPQFQILQSDPEVMEMVFRSFFDAFDLDKSGSIDFEELIVGLNMLLEGNRAEIHRMHFVSRDRNNDGVLTKEEAKQLALLNLALIKASFMLGIRTQKAELLECGLEETDFQPICDAITGVFSVYDIATLEVDLMFKYADKDGDGVVSLDEYVAWRMNDEEYAIRQAELAQLMEPCLRALKLHVQVAMTQLLQRVMR